MVARQRVLLHSIGYTIRDSSVRIHKVGAKKFLGWRSRKEHRLATFGPSETLSGVRAVDAWTEVSSTNRLPTGLHFELVLPAT